MYLLAELLGLPVQRRDDRVAAALDGVAVGQDEVQLRQQRVDEVGCLEDDIACGFLMTIFSFRAASYCSSESVVQRPLPSRSRPRM